MTWTAESALYAIAGCCVVVDPNGKPLETLLPETPNSDVEASASTWLAQHQDAIVEWVRSLGEHFAEHERIIIHEPSNWTRAVAMMRSASWPDQDSPANCETLLMNLGWWWSCVEQRQRGTAAYYASRMGRDLRHEAGARWIDGSLDMDRGMFEWAKRWAQSAFCRIEVAPKTAAALINSDAPKEVFAPWQAFSLIVPPGLCDPVRRLWCEAALQPSDGLPAGIAVVCSAVQENGHTVATNPDIPGAGQWTTRERFVMLENLVRGACIAIENGSARQLTSGSDMDRPLRGDRLPVPERWRVSAPVQDLRQLVIDEWSGKHRYVHFKSQWCVRGHYRNQACGPQLTERKRIWIHPYWKGDPAAVALVRTVKVDEP